MDGVAVAAQDMRLGADAAWTTSAAASGTTGIAATAGVRPGQGNPLLSTWTSGMSFTLNAGICSVQGTASATAGMYSMVLDTTATLTCTTSDPTNPRIDSVIAVVVDNGNNTSTYLFKILAGTPGVSPSPPSLPANSLLLCNIAVGANVSVLSAPNFTDKRVYTVSSGGILPYGTTTGATINGPAGAYVEDLATGRLRRLDGSGNARQAKTVAFAPVQSLISSSVTVSASGAAVTATSATVVTDGVTEIEIQINWAGFRQTPTATIGDTVRSIITLDGSAINSGACYHWTQFGGINNISGGGSFSCYVTPSAATHTIAWTMVTSLNTNDVLMVATPAAVASLRVSAVPG
jgi:hypothetical protein